MQGRDDHLAFFGGYENPLVNITAEIETPDFAARAKRDGHPPFAVLTHALCQATLEVENFRWRLMEGRPVEVRNLVLSHTEIDPQGNLTYTHIPYDADFATFRDRYIADRDMVRSRTGLRLTPFEDRDFIFVTALPWLRFTAIEHPIGRHADSSIPMFAIGRFERSADGLRFPVSVQAHHGLVDGYHIHLLLARLSALLAG